MDATGFTASPWAYNGKVFALSEDGDTYVMPAGPEFKVLGKNSLGEMSMATPAVANGSVIIRTASKLYRIGPNEMIRLSVLLLLALGSAPASRRELAGVARAVGQRRQPRNEPARAMVEDREHHLAARAARVVGIDRDHLGRAHLPERRAGNRAATSGRGPHQGRADLEEAT